MHKRKLGDFEVSAIGLGCMGMSDVYGPADEREAVATIHKALDLGVTLLNTSNEYGGGGNEELIARALDQLGPGGRDRAVINTKFGYYWDDRGRRHISGRPDFLRRECEDSLRRLKTDVIDIYSMHRMDTDTPIEETVGEMARLQAEGKIRALGLSEPGEETLRRAQAAHPISAVETEYSLWSRDAAEAILPVCRELGTGFIAYSPLGRGFLTGTVRSADDLLPEDRRHILPRFTAENIAENVRLVAVLDRLAADHGCSPAQISLAWVLAQGDDIVPIPGTKRVAYMEANAEAVALSLNDTTLAELAAAFPPGAAAGNRYHDAMMGQMGR